ncbi:MAG: sulfatase-like hydrolase/transferase [Desulfobulbaceae bacterium]|nr:sulfatase-like hydrolase/transferase [Desulfobulbaceae bacterium]
MTRDPLKLVIAQSIATVFFILCLALPLARAGTTGSKPAKKGTPAHEYTNVILISLQCLRPDHLGAYGYPRKTSQNIDQLAQKSLLFENAISQANLTPVAQMSVMTAQYPRVNGMVSFEVAKDSVSNRTLPEILKLYGYQTAATVSSPEFFLRYDTGTGAMVNPGDLFSRSFDEFIRTKKGPGGPSVRKIPTESFRWLRENRDKKFFLWIASGVIHMPYAATVPQPYKGMYDAPGYTPFWKRLPLAGWEKTVSADPDYDVFSRVHENKFYWDFQPAYQLTPSDVDFVNGRYDAGVYYTDQFIGELLKLLDTLKLTEKTLIVLQSIHGEDLGENGNFFHYDVTESVVKNALIFHFPGNKFAGKRIKEQMQGIDIMPTILDYLQIPPPHEAQGHSILPLVKGAPNAFRNTYTYIDRLPWWEFTLDKWYLDFKTSQGALFSANEDAKLPEYRQLLQSSFAELAYPPGDIAIRTNDWKLIVRKDPALLAKVSWKGFISGQPQTIESQELYDLKNDPQEKDNVLKKYPEVAAQLLEKLQAWDETTEKQKAGYRPNEQKLIIPYP